MTTDEVIQELTRMRGSPYLEQATGSPTNSWNALTVGIKAVKGIQELIRLRDENHERLEHERKVPYINWDDQFNQSFGSLCGIEEACDKILEAAGLKKEDLE